MSANEILLHRYIWKVHKLYNIIIQPWIESYKILHDKRFWTTFLERSFFSARWTKYTFARTFGTGYLWDLLYWTTRARRTWKASHTGVDSYNGFVLNLVSNTRFSRKFQFCLCDGCGIVKHFYGLVIRFDWAFSHVISLFRHIYRSHRISLRIINCLLHSLS